RRLPQPCPLRLPKGATRDDHRPRWRLGGWRRRDARQADEVSGQVGHLLMATRSLTAAQARLLKAGTVIPAHPLALDASRQLDERRQRALTRYYLAAGAGGVAVGVHTTQFEIRDVGLLEPVLRLAAEAVDAEVGDRPFLKVAGVLGERDQALREAE